MFLLAANAHALGGVVRITQSFDETIPLLETVQLFEDPTNEVTIHDIREGDLDDRFRRVTNKDRSLGYVDHSFWLAFEIDYVAKVGSRPIELYIKNNYPLLDEIDVYLIRQHPDPEVLRAMQNPLMRSENLDPYLQVFELGELRPFENNRFVFPRPIMGFELSQSERVQVFLRIRSGGSKVLQFELNSEESMVNYLLSEGAFLSAYYSIMLVMVIYNLFVYFAIRETYYFYYVLSITAFSIAQFSLDALPWALQIFDDPFWVNQFLPLMMCITWTFLVTFARSFMKTREYAPSSDILLRIMVLLFGYWACLAPLVDYNTYVQVAASATIALCLVVSTIGGYIWWKGYSQIRYFMFAWLFYVAGVGLLLAATLGYVDVNWLTTHSSQVGAVANVILLSLALADNINAQKRAMERAKRQADHARAETIRANERAQMNLARFRQIWENAREGIFQCTLDGRFLSANPTLAHILGYQSNEELIQSVHNISEQLYLNPPDRLIFEHQLQRNGSVDDYESLLMRRDGSQFWSSSSAHLVRDAQGKPLYIEGTLLDITERMEKEKAQRDREAAEASTAAKSEFLANMSHEIRTPMNAIIGFTDLALRSGLKPKQQDYLSKINTSAKNLLGIINDILDFSKIEAGRMELESTPFELGSVTRNLLDLFAERADQKGLELSIYVAPDVPRHLVGDPLRLGQVLINLIGNALKFTEEGEVHLAITLSQEPHLITTGEDELGGATNRKALYFRVKDTGIGIPEHKIPALFTPFTQVDGSTTRRFGGTGLGLSITRQIIELMNGEIDVVSEEGRGSEFRFTVSIDVQTEASDEEATVPFGEGRRVLLVDEPDLCQEATQELLRRMGFEVITLVPQLSWQRQVRELLGQDTVFDAILVDRNLQVVGTDLIAAEVKGCRPDCPLILMMLRSEEQLKDLARENGYYSLRKPLDERNLSRVLADALGIEGAAWPAGELDGLGVGLHDFSDFRVLLVEDTYFNQQLAIEYLDEVGVVPDLAENGEQALSRLNEQEYDLILMDCQMPVLDGYETTRRIRKNARWADLPIIAMTANAMKGDREKCLAAGMSDYVSKPIDPDLMYQAMRKALEGRKRQESPVPREVREEIEANQMERSEGGSLAETHDANLSREALERTLDLLESGNTGALKSILDALQASAAEQGADDVLKSLRLAAKALQESDTLPLEALLYRAEDQLNQFLIAKAS